MQPPTTFKTHVLKSNIPLTSPSAIPSTLVSLLPLWSCHSPSDVQISPLTGGLTNSIYKATLPLADPSSVLVRIFGAPQLFPASRRAIESIVYEQLSNAGIAPCLHANLPNGRVEQYLDARNIELYEMTQENILNGVARGMARMHKFEPYGDGVGKELTLWSDVEDWLVEVVQLVEAGNLRMPAGVSLRRCEEGMRQLRKELEGSDCPIVFCHNDVWSGNIMVGKDDTTVSFVDFEFSGFNYRGFDIGNFFSEAAWGKMDGVVQEVGYPSTSQRKAFCQEYLRSTRGSGQATGTGKADVDALMEEAESFGRAAHLHWGLWALKLSVESTVNYPYLDFAQHRLRLFLRDI
eukprot:GFKZ01006735.1.p1 GENE.GFKZ01006735.1~~GFKZ01006735.1.p1  ORF type:complete len:349 (+),score=42.76 GFKZ01006735.1:210-1256(+)